MAFNHPIVGQCYCQH